MKKKTILITGANRGIGFEAAHQLAGFGHKIILTGRDAIKAEGAAKSIGKDIIAHQLDVTSASSIKKMSGYLRDNHIQLDVLINNAGSVFDDYRGQPNPREPLDSSVEVLRKTLELNLIGAYAVIKNLFPFFNNQSRVDIINISSGMGALTDMGVGCPAYRISKTGLNSLTVYLASELSNTNIRVHSVCPGWVRTDLGGPDANRSPAEGVMGILWIVNEEPDINGQFVRDKDIINM
jgi:NAD(P)-dependent dehydrogenase (short-subunit alcohol dehydrogenase family)